MSKNGPQVRFMKRIWVIREADHLCHSLRTAELSYEKIMKKERAAQTSQSILEVIYDDDDA